MRDAGAELSSDSTTDREPVSPREPPPRQLGRYQVVDELGRGSHGYVVAAYDPMFGRSVAIKISADGERLRREATALALVSHPNVVAAHDFGETEGLHYLVMTRVRGEPLAAPANRKQAWREAVRLFIQVGRGLAAVHEAGIVHADVKPSNILIDEDRQAVLVDFGVACRADDPHARDWGGTVVYMPPERVRGEPPTALGDQFSFCVSLWEVIHGVRPWPRESLADLVADVGVPSERGRPLADVPAALDRIMHRGLAADPRERFENMNALVDALEQVLAAPDRRWLRWILASFAAVLAVLGLERMRET